MTRFSTILQIFFAIGVLFFSYGLVNTAQAQISTEPLSVTNILNFQAYPMYYGIPPLGQPSLCVLADFSVEQSTKVRLRVAPFSEENMSNPSWTLFPTVFEIDPPTEGINLLFGSIVEPNTEYMIQFIEIAEDGTQHLITPQNTTDDVRVMCTPNQFAALGSACPDNAWSVMECSPTGVFNAFGGNVNLNNNINFIPNVNLNNNINFIPLVFGDIIQNIQTTDTSITFDLITTSFTPSQNIIVAYSTSPDPITSGSFQGMTQQQKSVPAQSPLTITLSSLTANTPYYITILNNTASQILLPPAPGQEAYKIISTNSSQTSTITQGAPTTINVNIDGTFGQAELDGENIEQGFTQCGYGETYDCDFNQLLATIDRIIKFALYIVILPLAAILFAWSGIKLIIAKSQGKQAALSDAKSMFTRVLLGLVFAMGAWVIVKFVLVILGYTDASGVLSQILGITTTQ